TRLPPRGPPAARLRYRPCSPGMLGSGWFRSTDQRGAFWDLDRAEHLPPVLIQHRDGALVHHDVHRPAVDGEYRVAVPVDEVLPGPASLLGRRVPRNPEPPRAPGPPPTRIVAERVGCQLQRVPRRRRQRWRWRRLKLRRRLGEDHALGGLAPPAAARGRRGPPARQ